MAFKLLDGVWETFTTTGTGNLTLAGAAAGNLTFAGAGYVDGDTFHYSCYDVSGGQEDGVGMWGTGGVITRLWVFRSSNSNALVNWGAGTKNIMVTPLGVVAEQQMAAGNGLRASYYGGL